MVKILVFVSKGVNGIIISKFKRCSTLYTLIFIQFNLNHEMSKRHLVCKTLRFFFFFLELKVSYCKTLISLLVNLIDFIFYPNRYRHGVSFF